MPTQLIFFCRCGFEADLSTELRAGWAQGEVQVLQPGIVQWLGEQPAPRLARLVFARDRMRVDAELPALDPRDRVGGLAAVLRAWDYSGPLQLLCADSEQGKPLLPLAQALQKRFPGSNGAAADPRGAASALLLGSTHALVGWHEPGNCSPFPGGVARLRMPREAPSRSTLKLEEAFLVLLSVAERERLLRAGGSAVDLGAAPGGWSWQLLRRGLRVTAIDNGPMQAALFAGGNLTHLRLDGLRYLPPRPVDWLVCDMVEKPARVVEVILRWFGGGHCRAAIFNLKLPMKRRFEAWEEARQRLAGLVADGRELRARQLYHDREEITVALLPAPGRAMKGKAPGPGLPRRSRASRQ